MTNKTKLIAAAIATTIGTVLLLAPSPSVYVSQSGAGTACTQSAPCSMSGGMSRAVAGDTVEVLGVITTQTTWSKSGTAGNPITIHGGAFDGSSVALTNNAILMISASYVNIDNVEMYNFKNFGIRITQGGRHDVNISNVYLHDGVLEYMGADGTCGDPGGGWDSAIRFGLGTYNSGVTNSVLERMCGEGLSIVGAGGITFSNNIISDIFSASIYVDETISTSTVEGNVITCADPKYFRSGRPSSGMSYGDEGFSASREISVNVRNNTIRGCRGIKAYTPSGGKVTNSEIAFNDLSGVSGDAVFFTAAQIGSNVWIHDNVGKGFTAPGAILTANFTATPSGGQNATGTPTATRTQGTPSLTFTPVIIASGTPSASPTATRTNTATVIPPVSTPTLECLLFPAHGVKVCLP
jgi:hypothetical protein